MKRARKAWNGGTRETALRAAWQHSEANIAAGCERCPECRNDEARYAKGGPEAWCKTCACCGFLVPTDGMPMPTVAS